MFVTVIFIIGGLGLVASTFLVWGYAAYYYLKHGSAIDFTVITLAREYFCPNAACNPNAFTLWLYTPTDWVGLHMALSRMDIGFLLLGLGFLILILIDF